LTYYVIEHTQEYNTRISEKDLFTRCTSLINNRTTSNSEFCVCVCVCTQFLYFNIMKSFCSAAFFKYGKR